MAALARLLTLVLLVAGGGVPARAGTPAVTEVLAGGTLALSDGRKVRLLGVEFPRESLAAEESRQSLSFLVQGQPVRLEKGQPATDRNGIPLYYAYTTDGTFLNAEVIRSGYAYATGSYRFARLEEFRGYQRAARDQGQGLWHRRPTASPTPLPAPKAGTPVPTSSPAPAPTTTPVRRTAPAPNTPGALRERLIIIGVPGFFVFYLAAFLTLTFKSEAKASCLRSQLLLSTLAAAAGLLLLPLAVLLVTRWFHPTHATWAAGVLTVLSALSVRGAARGWHQGRLLRGAPLSRLRSASHGFAKVRGATRTPFGVLHSFTGGIPSLYYSESTEEYQRHTETYYDSQSKRTRTRTVYRWVCIHSDEKRVDFVLSDGTGEALVSVAGAEFHADHHAFFYNGNQVFSRPWIASVGDRRTTVHYIPPETTLTVWGRYQESHPPGSTEAIRQMAYDEYQKCMVIAEGREDRVYSGRTATALGLSLLAAVMLLGVGYLIISPHAF